MLGKLTWYNLGGLIRGYASGGIVDNYVYDTAGQEGGGDSTITYQDPAAYAGSVNPYEDASVINYGANAADDIAYSSADLNPALTQTSYGYGQDVVGNDNFTMDPTPLASSAAAVSTPVDWGHHTFTGESNDAQVNTAGGYGATAPGGVPPIQGAPVQSYLSPGQAGVNTGIPQGGHAADAIAAYFAGSDPTYGAGGGAGLSYNPEATGDMVTNWETEADLIGEGLAAESDAYVAAQQQAAADDEVVLDPTGEITLEDGTTTIGYDNEFEQPLAENIAEIIEEGGINPETGDYNISAGPNVLSAADEGAFGIGSDYNEEFQENYNAQYDHAEANPTGQSTGTPLYDQGYVGLGVDPLGDAVGGLVNNSTIGMIGEAITGNPLMADVSSLLPPEESFSNYNDDNDSGPANVNNDGDPTNDTGNAGWGFTSIADMFDGGGPGTSGDTFTGGIWGDSTHGDATDGWQPSDVAASPTTTDTDSGGGFNLFSPSTWGGGSSSDDSGGSDSGGGGGGGGGYSCYVATALRDAGHWSNYKRVRLIKWCMDTKPEGKLDTKLWRNGYCWFGKEVIAPRVNNKIIQWLSDGFYESTVGKKVTVKSMLGKAFFYIPSYKMGLWKWMRGELEEIDRT